MSEENIQATENLTPTVDVDLIKSMHDEVSIDGVQVGETEEKAEVKGQEAPKVNTQAPVASDKAPQIGGKAPVPAAEQPKRIKLEGITLDPDTENFLKAQKLLDDNGLDPLATFKQMREAVKFGTEARQSLSNAKNQLDVLQQKEDITQELPSREDVETAYRTDKQTYNVIIQEAKKTLEIPNLPPEAKRMAENQLSWGQDALEAAGNERNKKLQEIHDVEFAKAHGLYTKGNPPQDSFKDADKLFIDSLTEQERADKKIINTYADFISPIFYNLASVMYPKEYNKGKTPEEISKNNSSAAYRAMVSNPEMVKTLVNAARAIEIANNSEIKSKETEKTAYERGLSDGIKGKKPNNQPSGAPVMQPKSVDERSSLVSGMFEEIT